MRFSLPLFLRLHWINIVSFTLAIAGFIIDWYAFYPGFMSPDTIDQYTQALSNSYSDWHPPIMSFLWRLLIPIYNGPLPMLFLQLFLLWFSFFLLMRLLLKTYPFLFVLAIFFVLAPFIQNFAGNIWKDVQMTQSWLFASMIIISAIYQDRKMHWMEAALSYLAICYGCWLRSNALPGAIPLFAFWLIGFFGSPSKGWKPAFFFIGKVAVLTLLCLILQIGVTRLIIKPQKSYIEYKLFAQDLSSIYLKTNDFSFPEFIRNDPAFDTVYLRKNYLIYTFDQFWWNADNKRIFTSNLDDDKITEMRNYWLRAIVRHPQAYMEIKGLGSLYFLRIYNSGTRVETFYPYIHPNSFGFNYTPGKAGNYFIRWMYKVKDSFYMKPWFWAVLNLCILGACFITFLARVRKIVFCICLSSFLYLVAQFFVFPADTELRYFYWNCMTVSLGGILIIAEGFYYLAATSLLRQERN